MCVVSCAFGAVHLDDGVLEPGGVTAVVPEEAMTGGHTPHNSIKNHQTLGALNQHDACRS